MTTPFGKFFLPGPTEVLPEVAKAQEQPMIGHRGAKTEALLGRLDEPLKAAFRTKQPVYIAATSATGLMEAAIRNGVRKKVLCLVNGSFSERFAKIAAACGKEVVKAKVPLGQAFEADAVKGLLDSSGADAVTLCHSETSTGVLNPIADIAKVVLAKPDVMYLVDAVTSLGGSPVETDAWGLDFVLTGSQKAFALPPGLAFGVASPRLLERAKTLPDRGIYLDLIPYDTSIRKRQTPYTPALSLMYALEAQLCRIAADGGIEKRWARHNAMRERVERWVAKEAGAQARALLSAARRAALLDRLVPQAGGGREGLGRRRRQGDGREVRLHHRRGLRGPEGRDDPHRSHGRPHRRRAGSAAGSARGGHQECLTASW